MKDHNFQDSFCEQLEFTVSGLGSGASRFNLRCGALSVGCEGPFDYPSIALDEVPPECLPRVDDEGIRKPLSAAGRFLYKKMMKGEEVLVRWGQEREIIWDPNSMVGVHRLSKKHWYVHGDIPVNKRIRDLFGPGFGIWLDQDLCVIECLPHNFKRFDGVVLRAANPHDMPRLIHYEARIRGGLPGVGMPSFRARVVSMVGGKIHFAASEPMPKMGLGRLG